MVHRSNWFIIVIKSHVILSVQVQFGCTFLQDVDVTAELISMIQSQDSQQQLNNDCPKVTPIITNGTTINSSHTDDTGDSVSTEATNITVISKSLSCSTTAAASEAPADISQYMTATEDTVIHHQLSHNADNTRQQQTGASSVHNNGHIQQDPSEDEHWD